MTVYKKIQAGGYEVGFEYTRANCQSYHEEQARLQDEFKHDLEVEYALTKHPKRDLLFSLAWSIGHSSGYSEVWNYYNEMAELLQP
jgi:hypothetical protein